MPRIGITGGGLGLGHGGVRLTGGCVPVAQIDGSVSVGATFTHPADGVIAWTQTTVPPADGSRTRMVFRRLDALNFWYVSVETNGNLTIFEVVAGVATLRGSAGTVIANGDRIVVVAEGTTIEVYEANTLRITYSSAANFATATAGRRGSELAGAVEGGVVSDIKTWTLGCRAQEGV